MSRRQSPPREPPDLRQFAGKVYLRGSGDSNGQVLVDPRGRSLLGRYSRNDEGMLVHAHGSTYSGVLSELGIARDVVRSHGSARFGGLSYTTGWWVTPLQLTAIRAADDVIRRLDPDAKSFDEVKAAAIAAARAVMSKTED